MNKVRFLQNGEITTYEYSGNDVCMDTKKYKPVSSGGYKEVNSISYDEEDNDFLNIFFADGTVGLGIHKDAVEFGCSIERVKLNKRYKKTLEEKGFKPLDRPLQEGDILIAASAIKDWKIDKIECPEEMGGGASPPNE